VTPIQLTKQQLISGRGVIDGLAVNPGADADHDLTISAGVTRDSTDTYMMTLLSPLTKQSDAAWAAGNNAGGMFVGSVQANTYYHCFLILKEDGTIDAGLDTSLVCANRPAGYIAHRRIATRRTNNNGDWFIIWQLGDQNLWQYPRWDALGVTLGTTPTLFTLSTPPGVRVFPIAAFVTFYKYNSTVYGAVYSPEISGPGIVDLQTHVSQTTNYNAWPVAFGATPLRTNTSSQVLAGSQYEDSLFYFCSAGYFDPRGKDE
jgi:hypothetical protein